MIIGIDATSWWNNRGFGRFTRELLKALVSLDSPHHFHLFVDQPLDAFADCEQVSVTQVATSTPTTEAAVADGNRSPGSMWAMYRAVSATPLDVMFFPAVYSWYPVPWRQPTVVTVMDAIAEHYPELVFTHWKNRLFWTIKMKLAVASSSRIFSLTEASKAEVVEYIGVNPEQIDLVGAAPNPAFQQTTDLARQQAARQRAGIPVDARLLVYVGGLAPHKNLLGFLDGLEIALREAEQAGNSALDSVYLGLIGDLKGAGFHSNYEALQARVEQSTYLRDRVGFCGYVSDEDLIALYSSATAAAMPSFSEGFGLPAIESMACGAPVLSSTLGSLPEVVGDAGVYFDPHSAREIAEAITRLLSDPALHERLAHIGLERSAQFTWERVAQRTLSHLEALVGSRA